MVSIRQLSRRSATSIHLGISTVIAAAALAVMLLLWYPPPLFGAMGGAELVTLFIVVDVVIGPFLTYVVFDARKKELAFDLAVIALLQLGALGYGAYAMHAGRPAFIAFVEDRFVVVSAAEIDDDLLAEARPEFRSVPEGGPIVVAVDMPQDPVERTNLFFAGLAGMGAQHVPQYYVPYEKRTSQVLAAARPLARFPQDSAGKAELDKAVARLRRPPEEVRFVPMRTRKATLTAIIDGRDARLLSLVAADPADAR